MNPAFDDVGDLGHTGGEARSERSVIDDVAFLTRARHRVTTLDALADEPRSRSDLRSLTGVSSSTIGRTLGEFERRNWICKDGDHYETTMLGAYVASGVAELLRRFETERKLRDVWQWLPDGTSGLSAENLSDAVVTVADASAPYRPVNRFTALLRETDRFRFVGLELALLEPCKDEFRRLVLDGMRAEIIDPPSVARYVLSTYRDHCSGPLESGELVIRVHDDLPAYGISIFDDRVGISGYDEGGTVRVLIDTDSPGARTWAESTYEAYRREARPLSRETAV